MFRCQICGQVAPAGAKSEKLVVAVRDKVYPIRGDQSPRRRGRSGGGPRKPIDKGGEGREIVQEVIACPDCAEKHHAEQAEIAAQAEAAAEVAAAEAAAAKAAAAEDAAAETEATEVEEVVGVAAVAEVTAD